MGVYENKPDRFVSIVFSSDQDDQSQRVCCAGFELSEWRCRKFAKHLIEWLPEYALPEEQLNVTHANIYVKLQEAAIRVYTSKKYESRGEAGEIALHAVCRDFFDTRPISPRVFYKSTSNEVIKAFDMVHARFPHGKPVELWLGESKLYTDRGQAIKSAISSIGDHLKLGFLTEQKLILGPQIPQATPRFSEVAQLFKPQTSIDQFLAAAVFVVGIAAESKAVKESHAHDENYKGLVATEALEIVTSFSGATWPQKLRFVLIYFPLGSKEKLVSEFDLALKGLQP